MRELFVYFYVLPCTFLTYAMQALKIDHNSYIPCQCNTRSTVSLKLAVFVLFLVSILHAVGVVVPRWSVLKSDINIDELRSLSDIDYHVGLWRDCNCVSVLGTTTCDCTSKDSTTDAFKTVQGMETIGLIGLIIAGIISLIILFSRQDNTLKAINIVIVFGSGVLILIGVVVYAVECNDDYYQLFSYISIPLNLDTNPARLSISFILCTIAGALCILVCTALLVYDQRTASTANRPEQQLRTRPVQYTNHGQINAPAPGQVIIHTHSPQPSGYEPRPDYAPQYQPAAQFHPHGLPYKAQ